MEIWEEEAMDMVNEQIISRGITDSMVIEAMKSTPRHMFISSKYRGQAYDDHPLPIDEGQTISQPYIVALMTDKLDLSGNEKVLEIGTGSGYQAAILAQTAKEVYTLEIYPKLARQASEKLSKYGYHNVHVKQGNGYLGWEEHAPYDRIILTAAPPEIPSALIAQLKIGGRMILPVGETSQKLLLITKDEKGIQENTITFVRFVPMIEEVK